ncbi:MAG: RsmE family RNA methyltransferase [Ignavibacteria bacterium]
MEYYYTPAENVDIKNNLLVIDGIEFRHLTKVLRKKEGDQINVTDGLLNIYECKISKVESLKIVCNISATKYNLYEPDINLTLYISPLRNISRFEFAIEKAVELGVKFIQPVVTDRTISKGKFGNSKLERFRKIIVGAMGQSQRCYLPLMNNNIKFQEMIDATASVENKIVMYEYSDGNNKYKRVKNYKDAAVLIGCEGGFTNEEISQLLANSWHVLSLGERKFRSETAAIISLHEILSGVR